MKKVFCIFVLLAQIPSIGWADACQAGYQPVDYQALEYIESTGTQYIDIGTTVSSTDTFDIKMAWTEFRTLTTFFGSKENTDWLIGRYIGITYTGAQGEYKLFYSEGKTRSTLGDRTLLRSTVNTINTMHWQPSSNIFTFNGTDYQGVTDGRQTTDVFTTANNPYIFATDQAGTAAQLDYVRLYSFKITNTGGTLVRDFVPARRLSDNAVGLWDEANNVFYENAGTGTFIAGPETYETIFANDGVCVVCPPNTYKDTVGNVPCTPCPSTTFSKSGSTSINDCGHVMHVGDKIYFLNSQKLTTPALYVRMPDGSIYYGSLYRQQTE